MKLTAIEVPLLLRWTPSGVARVRPTISAGPSVSFNQQCSNHLTVTVGSTTTLHFLLRFFDTVENQIPAKYHAA